MSEYGLTGLRDADGTRQPVEHTHEYGGDAVTIRFIPPTLNEVDEIEAMIQDDDLDIEEIQQPLDDYLVKPSLPDDEGWTLREFDAYITAIYEWSMGAEGIHAEVRDELEGRENGTAGN
jgi:hypothetical protein